MEIEFDRVERARKISGRNTPAGLKTRINTERKVTPCYSFDDTRYRFVTKRTVLVANFGRNSVEIPICFLTVVIIYPGGIVHKSSTTLLLPPPNGRRARFYFTNSPYGPYSFRIPTRLTINGSTLSGGGPYVALSDVFHRLRFVFNPT